MTGEDSPTRLCPASEGEGPDQPDDTPAWGSELGGGRPASPACLSAFLLCDAPSVSLASNVACGENMMIILCPVGFCGMTPKAGATVAAIYMILVTNIYLIFEVGHLERAMTDMAQIKPFNLTKVGKMLTYCYYTAITLAVMTYPVCAFLIYSVQKRLYMGMFAYVAWITFYDLANCLIVALAYQVSKEAWFSLSPLEWFGLATRSPMDCFWLSFVVTYALMVIESKGQEWLSLRMRRSSRIVSEPPRFRLGSTARKGV